MDYEFTLSGETLALMENDEPELKINLAADILRNKDNLSQMCATYCEDKRGTVDADSFKISPEDISIDGESGNLSVSFFEEAYFGCRDMDLYDEHSVWFEFTFDKANRQVVFHVDETPEREPDEY